MTISNFFKDFIIKRIKKNKRLSSQIVVDSFLGQSLDSNCIKIANHLAQKYPVIFATRKPENCDSLNPKIKIVKYGSIQHIKYLHNSKVLINNSRYHSLLSKKTHQTYIQLWHGIPYKKLVFDQSDISAAWKNTNKYRYLAGFLNEVDKWDYLFAPNQYTAERFKTSFLYDKTLIQANYPSSLRSNSISQDEIEKIKRVLNIPKDKKIILYAPTFREFAWDKENKYLLSGILPEAFFQKFSDYVFLFRTHYLINQKFDFSLSNNIIDVTNYPFIEELYQISDLLITDYSSVLFEFARFEKPVICYQNDLQEYVQKRGLYDVSPVDLGMTIFTQWDEIVLDFNKRSYLTDKFALVEANLLDEIDKIILEKFNHDLGGNKS